MEPEMWSPQVDTNLWRSSACMSRHLWLSSVFMTQHSSLSTQRFLGERCMT
jgi:hypothetical protein